MLDPKFVVQVGGAVFCLFLCSACKDAKCRPESERRWVEPRGEVIQSETKPTKRCDGDECGVLALSGFSISQLAGKNCEEVRQRLKKRPLIDDWGGRLRVHCNGKYVQAASPGRDGEFGTCDDFVRRLNLNAVLLTQFEAMHQ